MCKFAVNVCQVYCKKAKKRFRSPSRAWQTKKLMDFAFLHMGGFIGYGLSVSQSKPRDHSKLSVQVTEGEKNLGQKWHLSHWHTCRHRQTLVSTTFGAKMTFIWLAHMQAQTGTHFHKIWGKNDIYLIGSRAGTDRHVLSQKKINLGQKWHSSVWLIHAGSHSGTYRHAFLSHKQAQAGTFPTEMTLTVIWLVWKSDLVIIYIIYRNLSSLY